jgi:hypothetical protein
MTFPQHLQSASGSDPEEIINETDNGLLRQSPNNSEAASSRVSRKEASNKAGNDVGALVAKSKKAAASLWTLLHAKVRPANRKSL